MKNKSQNSGGGTVVETSSPYLSPRDLAERWRCSRTSVQRITEQAGIGKLVLGNGKNATVRYLRADVERYEQTRSI